MIDGKEYTIREAAIGALAESYYEPGRGIEAYQLANDNVDQYRNSVVTSCTTTGSTWCTIYTTSTGSGAMIATPSKPVLLPGDIEVWEVGNKLFESKEEAEAFALDNIMGGNTVYPTKKKYRGCGDDITAHTNKVLTKVSPRFYIEHHGDYYIYDSEKPRTKRGVSDSEWIRCLPKAEAYRELEKLNNTSQLAPWNKHFWMGQSIDHDGHMWVTYYPTGVQKHKTLDHARSYIRQAINKYGSMPRLLEKKGDIRKSKSGNKWIVANHFINKDFIADSYDAACQYIDAQNKIEVEKRKYTYSSIIAYETDKGDVAEKPLAPNYYVKRDDGKWCIFDRNSKNFGYDTKVYIDPKTKRLAARNYMEARRRCQELNNTQKRTGITYCYDSNTAQYVVTVDGQFNSAWTSEDLAKYRVKIEKDLRAQQKRLSESKADVADITSFAEAMGK